MLDINKVTLSNPCINKQKGTFTYEIGIKDDITEEYKDKMSPDLIEKIRTMKEIETMREVMKQPGATVQTRVDNFIHECNLAGGGKKNKPAQTTTEKYQLKYKY